MQLQNPQHLRLFVAVLLPDEIKAAIEEAQEQLRQAMMSNIVRWTKREQFHLTLRFLGNVEASRPQALTDALCLACQGFPPLQMRAEHIGFFPNQSSPRVIWVGIEDFGGRLSILHRAVQQATREFTTEKTDDTFTGHVTLGRIKQIKRSEAQSLAEAANTFSTAHFGKWTANQIDLMRSELSPEGARHSSVAAVALSGQGT